MKENKSHAEGAVKPVQAKTATDKDTQTRERKSDGQNERKNRE